MPVRAGPTVEERSSTAASVLPFAFIETTAPFGLLVQRSLARSMGSRSVILGVLMTGTSELKRIWAEQRALHRNNAVQSCGKLSNQSLASRTISCTSKRPVKL